MFYKPNYCCNCGEKIERVDWRFTNSRRFCDVCQTEYLVQDWAPSAFVIIMAVIGLFGVGSMFRGNAAPARTPEKRLASSPPNLTSNRPAAADPVRSTQNSDSRPPANVAKRPRQAVLEPERAEDPAEACGAPTKKGTPCTRRVKGGGRCWQHKETAESTAPRNYRGAP